MRLGLLVLGKIIDDFQNVEFELGADFRIAFNLSSEEFMDKRVISELLYMIGQSQFDFSKFCIEITETTVLDNIQAANDMILYLNQYGVIVAIDDFGTGFSSLSYLKQLQIDKLKIDRMFIMDYPEKDDGTIFKAIMTMANNMGLKTVIEGIETPKQLEYGKELGCDEYQGYIYSEPVQIDQLGRLL
jgi:EAL domain-containing protein (putative c-di-GMP-specific phosphodiesterase class I)